MYYIEDRLFLKTIGNKLLIRNLWIKLSIYGYSKPIAST